MKKHLSLLIIAVCLLQSVAAQSLQSPCFEERSFSLGGGRTSMIDTYLSPLSYSGPHAALLSERFSQTKVSNGQWYAQSLFALQGDYTTSQSGSGLTVGGMADYSYTFYYRLPLKGEQLSIYMGPQGQLRIGGIYNLRNSNNPAQLKLGMHLAASAMGKCAFKLWKTPMNVRLQADLPLLGAAFGPDYGQSYYEIFYLRQSEGCLHTTSLHNNLSLRTKFDYDVQLRPCTLRLTYANDLYQWTLGNQHYRMFTHSVMVGLVRNLYRVENEDDAKQYIPY